MRVAQLSWTPKGKGTSVSAYRLHTQFEILRGVPSRIDVTPANPKGENDERAVLARTIQRDRCYVIDRGYAQFTLWNAIVATKSSYVCRVRDNAAYVVERINELIPADRAAGVQSDEIVIFGGRRAKQDRVAGRALASSESGRSIAVSRRKASVRRWPHVTSPVSRRTTCDCFNDACTSFTVRGSDRPADGADETAPADRHGGHRPVRGNLRGGGLG